MSKKSKPLRSVNQPNLQEKPVDFSNTIVTIILTLYLLVECSPKFELQDQMGLHWLLLSVLNVGAFAYILKSKILIDSQLVVFFKNSITLLYLIFFALTGFSLFAALNSTEGLVVYSRVFTSITTFFVIGILLYKRLAILKNLVLIIAIITFLQAFETIMYFYKNVGTMPIDTLIYNLQGTSGNKNIWAAAFVIKIPFIIYCIFTREGFTKILAFLSLALSFFAIFLINARSSFIGLILELFIVFGAMGYLNFKEKKLKLYGISSAYIILALVISFFVTQNSLIKATENKSSTYGTVGSRLGGIAESTDANTNIRIAYWKGSWEIIKQQPLTGVGIGNWKIYSPLYTNKLLNDNVFSKHPHNDFIELAGETGIPNALIFLSIFVAALIITFKTIFSTSSIDQKILAVIAFTALSGYFVDAFFNFPGERPNIQFLFALALALLVATWLGVKPITQTKQTFKLISTFGLTVITIGFGSIYVNAMVFKSSAAQHKVDNDLAAIDGIDAAMPKLKYQEVNQIFPKIPNIGENSETIGYKKAKYLQKEKRFAEAIKLLDSVHHQSPNIIYDYYLKCNIYLEQKKLDSAYKYAKMATYAKPRNFYYYRMASYLARMHEDIPEINKLFKNYNTYRDDQQAWSYYSLSMFFSKADRKEVKKIVDLGLKKFPNDTVMLSYIPYLPK